MKKFLLIFALSCLMVSCKSTTVSLPEVVYKKPTMLIDSIYMTMPGMLHYVDNHLILEDAFTITNFYKVYDLNGVWLRDIAPKGNASTEFITPNLLQLNDGRVLVSDNNKGTAVTYDLATNNLSVYNEINRDILRSLYLTAIDEDFFVTMNDTRNGETGDGVLCICNKASIIKSFGKLPISEKINNKFDLHQGFLYYNKNNETLVYTASRLPYFAIFKRDGCDFKLVKESTYANFSYEMKDGYIDITHIDGEVKHAQALLKDYIVIPANSEEDLKNLPPKDGSMRDFTQLPRTIYLYDYEFNLKQIISTQTGILRVASNINSNTLYLVNYIEGEFSVSKLDID